MELTENKSDDMKDSFCEEPQHVFHQFPIHRMQILLEDLNAKVGREYIS
jgi:hypothetical protein